MLPQNLQYGPHLTLTNSEPKNIIAEQAYEIQRLKMENELLRDFLQFTERG